MFPHADSEASDLTGWMPRLIRVFAGRIGHFAGFVMWQLICLKCTHSNKLMSHFHDLVSLKPMTRTWTSDFTAMSLNGRVPCERLYQSKEIPKLYSKYLNPSVPSILLKGHSKQCRP